MPSITDNSHETSGMEMMENKQAPFCGSYRLFVTLIASITLCTSLASQTSMNSAIVCMKKPQNDHNISRLANHTGTQDNNPWTIDWDAETKGWVIASFFIGYCIMQIPAGVLVNKFGAKLTVVIGLFSTAIFHFITVPAARWNMPLLYIVRFLAGLTCVISLDLQFVGPDAIE